MESEGGALDPELASRLVTAAEEAARALGKPAPKRSLTPPTDHRPQWLKRAYLERRGALHREVASSARHLRQQGLTLLEALVILRKTITEMAAAPMISESVLETVLAEISVWTVSEFHRLEP